MNKSGDSIDSAKKVNGTDQLQPITPITGIVQPSYRKLQDADSNWKVNGDQIEMVKQNGTDADIDDGAQEKMLKDEPKTVVTPSKNSTEQVKFGVSNGETKVDIEVSKPIMSGMDKEELMKFASDPFWVRIRWIMFALFWILWFAMLAGAIAIILLAPKCAVSEPKKFWEESVMVDLDFSEAIPPNFDGLTKMLEELQKHNVLSISLPPIYVDSETNQVTNFTSVAEKYGGNKAFERFLNATKDRKQNVVMELNPHFSSLSHNWFEKSKNKDDQYSDYYIWRNASNHKDDTHDPPTPSKNWQWNEDRQQFYLFIKNNLQPCFNYRNPMVVNELKRIMEQWLSLGVKGFRLLGESSLIKEENGEPDITNNTQLNAELLKDLKQFVLNKTDNQGVLAFKEPLGSDIVGIYKPHKAVDLVYTSKIVKDVNEKPDVFSNSIISLLENDSAWPGWDLKRFITKNKEEAENIMLFTLLLPGTTILKKSDINENTRSMFSVLSKSRSDEAFKFGDYLVKLLHNATVIAYTRVKSGSPGFLVAYNSNENAAEVDFSEMKFVSGNLKVLAHSSNYEQNGTTKPSNFNSKSALLMPKSTLAMTFVPSSD